MLAVVLLGSGVLGWWGTNGGPILSAYQWFITQGMETELSFRPLPGRGPARLASYTQSVVQAAVLAAVCVSYFLLLRKLKERRLLAVLTVGLLASDLLISNGAVHRYKPPDHFSSVPSSVEFLRKDRGMWRMYRMLGPDWYKEALESDDPGQLMLNTPALYGIDTLAVNPATQLTSVTWYWTDMLHDQFAIYNVKYLLFQRDDPTFNLLARKRFRQGKYHIYEIPEWQPRVAIRDQYDVVANLEDVKHLLNSDQFIPSESVIINEEPTPMLSLLPP